MRQHCFAACWLSHQHLVEIVTLRKKPGNATRIIGFFIAVIGFLLPSSSHLHSHHISITEFISKLMMRRCSLHPCPGSVGQEFSNSVIGMLLDLCLHVVR